MEKPQTVTLRKTSYSEHIGAVLVTPDVWGVHGMDQAFRSKEAQIQAMVSVSSKRVEPDGILIIGSDKDKAKVEAFVQAWTDFVEALPEERDLLVCSRCGSDQLFRDAFVEVNDPDNVIVFDSVVCQGCDIDKARPILKSKFKGGG